MTNHEDVSVKIHKPFEDVFCDEAPNKDDVTCFPLEVSRYTVCRNFFLTQTEIEYNEDELPCINTIEITPEQAKKLADFINKVLESDSAGV